MSEPMQYQMVIGLEVHIQLNTTTKLFSGSPNQFGEKPNTNLSLLDVALPGTLPVVNHNAVAKGILFGLAVGAKINRDCYFERKNYFYPDLPKGYQITQNQCPINLGGAIDLSNGRKVRLNRAHLEEDAGKSIHNGPGIAGSGIDLNRAGVPLLEIVTEPDIESTRETILFLKTLHSLVKELDISNAQMQEGSFRCDVNISLRENASAPLGVRVELKNLNSFKFIAQAIDYEYERQSELLKNNQPIYQETRLFDVDNCETRPMRSKEDVNDYRYFPDPDLPKLNISQSLIDKLKKQLPISRAEKLNVLSNEYGLRLEDAEYFATHSESFDYLRSIVASIDSAQYKLAVSLIRGDISRYLNENSDTIKTIQDLPLSTSDVALLINSFAANKITKKQIRDCIKNVLYGDCLDVTMALSSLQSKVPDNSDEIKARLTALLNDYPKQAEQLRAGKQKISGFFYW